LGNRRHGSSIVPLLGKWQRSWLNLEVRYDLEVEKDKHGDCVENEVSVLEEAN